MWWKNHPIIKVIKKFSLLFYVLILVIPVLTLNDLGRLIVILVFGSIMTIPGFLVIILATISIFYILKKVYEYGEYDE